jgi:hypothetical protein
MRREEEETRISNELYKRKAEEKICRPGLEPPVQVGLTQTLV